MWNYVKALYLKEASITRHSYLFTHRRQSYFITKHIKRNLRFNFMAPSKVMNRKITDNLTNKTVNFIP